MRKITLFISLLMCLFIVGCEDIEKIKQLHERIQQLESDVNGLKEQLKNTEIKMNEYKEKAGRRLELLKPAP
ncbi:MAG: hypothetical protein Q8N96_11420 [Methylovulum sp.]|nr:hypothetical protein [Methylovulum sp.]